MKTTVKDICELADMLRYMDDCTEVNICFTAPAWRVYDESEANGIARAHLVFGETFKEKLRVDQLALVYGERGINIVLTADRSLHRKSDLWKNFVETEYKRLFPADYDAMRTLKNESENNPKNPDNNGNKNRKGSRFEPICGRPDFDPDLDSIG